MKKNRYTYSLVITMALLGLLHIAASNQNDGEEIQQATDLPIPPLVQKELDAKLQKYQKTILDKCRNKAVKAAETYIDSLVAAELKFQTRDTLKFPAQPKRPDLREPIILNDSTAITPILNTKPDSLKEH